MEAQAPKAKAAAPMEAQAPKAKAAAPMEAQAPKAKAAAPKGKAVSESTYVKRGALPNTLTVVQDNTASECKNQQILKVVAKWQRLILQIRCHGWLGYPWKGHTHGYLDGVFGQATAKLTNVEFQDDEDVECTCCMCSSCRAKRGVVGDWHID